MNAPETGALQVRAEATKTILPDAEGVFDAIARIGYEFEHAVADLVDNSIDAKASNVLVRFIYDDNAVRSVAVIDDGDGMDARQVDDAMAFGARTGKGDDSLGKYGMGLKSASFRDARPAIVFSLTCSWFAHRSTRAVSITSPSLFQKAISVGMGSLFSTMA